MRKKNLGKRTPESNGDIKKTRRTPARPLHVPQTSVDKKELCPECFKVVGEKSRYNLVCMLGRNEQGMTVAELTEKTKLRQPTVTHHLQALRSVSAVEIEPHGRTHIYKLNRNAHCFEECKIPY